MKKLLFSLSFLLPLGAGAQLVDSNARLVHVKGTVNFRDLGGYKTADGHVVKWGKVYRSADISHLTDSDMDTLQNRHIHTVVDFRGTQESAKAPDHLLPKTDYILCPAGSDSLPDPSKMAAIMSKGNMLQEMYGNTRYLEARYRPFFQKLSALPQDEALLFHCTGGRDRTGIGAALLLNLLGVPENTIIEDYTASNVYLKPMNETWVKQMAAASKMDEAKVRDMMLLRPELIQSTFAAIRKDYGSMEAFYEKGLGLDSTAIGKLKLAYLN